jgi:hypothetical protein
MSVRDALGLHSIRVHIIMSTLVTYLLAINEAALPVLNGLPPEMRAKMPYAIGIGLLVIGVIARMLAQPTARASVLREPAPLAAAPIVAITALPAAPPTPAAPVNGQ